MNIYSQYVYYNKLVSPINQYECKVITKQNIKQFGFNSIEELLNQFPGFPIKCKSTLDKSSNSMVDVIIERKKRSSLKYTSQERDYYKEYVKRCPNCLGDIKFSKRFNKFCSASCGSTYNNKLRPTKSEEQKKQIAKSLRKYYKNKSNGITGLFNKNTVKLFKDNCMICNNIMFTPTKRKICNSEFCHREQRVLCGKKSAQSIRKRSKKEIELYNLCKNYFKNISCNNPMFNGWDADVILHDEKIAILWNGPWHYREMGLSNHSLKQVVNRDIIKIIEIESLGYRALIYNDDEWTPTEAFVDIILTSKQQTT